MTSDPLATSQVLVTFCCAAAGGLCFLLYLWQTVVTILAKPAVMSADVGKKTALLAAQPGVSIDELTKLFQAISQLTDSLAKAGPALTSLVGAIFFFAIAAVSSGSLHGAANPAPVPASADIKDGK